MFPAGVNFEAVKDFCPSPTSVHAFFSRALTDLGKSVTKSRVGYLPHWYKEESKGDPRGIAQTMVKEAIDRGYEALFLDEEAITYMLNDPDSDLYGKVRMGRCFVVWWGFHSVRVSRPDDPDLKSFFNTLVYSGNPILLHGELPMSEPTCWGMEVTSTFRRYAIDLNV